MSSGNDMRVKSLLTNREREVFELLVARQDDKGNRSPAVCEQDSA